MLCAQGDKTSCAGKSWCGETAVNHAAPARTASATTFATAVGAATSAADGPLLAFSVRVICCSCRFDALALVAAPTGLIVVTGLAAGVALPLAKRITTACNSDAPGVAAPFGSAPAVIPALAGAAMLRLLARA